MLPIILSLAAAASAMPLIERQAITDIQILNYALTLEHLENAFYKMGLANYTAKDFRAAGTGPHFYNNLKEISFDEDTHVNFLAKELGAAAVQPCTYAFPSTDAKSFLAVASVLEGVGVSAYLGAAKFIMSKDYLTAAGSILTVEARHSAYLRTFNKQSPFPAPFDIPLTFNEVFSLASQFIVSCPESNPALPVMAFPAISVAPATPAKAGDVLALTVASPVEAMAAWFITILGPVSAPMTGSGTSYSITVPEGAPAGQSYLVLTKDMGNPTDDNTAAGPAIIEIQDNISGKKAKPVATPAPYHSEPAPAPTPAPGTDAPKDDCPEPVTEMGDGQPIQQIGDGQVQVHPVSQMPDGQPTAPGY